MKTLLINMKMSTIVGIYIFSCREKKKLLTFFQQKNIRILYIESAKIVNEMTLNELVKLTTL